MFSPCFPFFHRSPFSLNPLSHSHNQTMLIRSTTTTTSINPNNGMEQQIMIQMLLLFISISVVVSAPAPSPQPFSASPGPSPIPYSPDLPAKAPSTAMPPSDSPATGPSPANTGSGAALAGPVALKLKSLCTELTSYPDICTDTMAPFVAGKASIDDMMVVLQASIKAAVHEANALIELANQYEATATSSATQASIKSCKNDYNDALEDIQTAVDAIPSGDYGTLSTYLSSAIDGFADCDDEFSGINPLQSQNARLRHIVDNCLAFAENVNWP